MPSTNDWDDGRIVALRPPKNPVDPSRPHAFLVEPEHTRGGTVEETAVIFLTNRECPFRCLMCDLWKNTTDRRVADGAAAGQVEYALARLPPARHLKLYNAGNFFDAQAVPPADWPHVAELVAPFRTVIVENHPRLVGDRCLAFRDLLRPALEVAMGLETAHPGVLARLNKRMTLADFETATRFLTRHNVAVRAFILLRPPFLGEEEGVHWAKESIRFAFDVGVECCVIIPARAGNGAMEELQRQGQFASPRLESLEEVLDHGIGLRRGRVFADLWDVARFYPCERCGPARAARLHEMNLSQQQAPPDRLFVRGRPMTTHEKADLLILGAGFAGSLMALIARRLGLRPVLVEKGRHPRFAIGESSTPIANLVLEQFAHTYDLPRLLPLTKYGRWQAAYPHLACGLKRGFTFVRHQPGQLFEPRPDHANELLVAASPRDEIGDTHWFREHFDQFVVEEARAAGVPYYDQAEVVSLEHRRGWRGRAIRPEGELHVTADFLVDATGPSGLLPRTLGIPADPATVRTNSWSVFSHFTGVELWQDVLLEAGGTAGDHPYACDHAALHHVLEDGWIWVLRFNNGVTSAGVMYDGERRPPDGETDPEAQWAAMLDRYPSVARQFARARPVQPWVRTGRVQRRVRRAAGADWAMLAHAGYFLDPLFSSGNAHSLLTIERLARILARHWGRTSLKDELAAYEASLLREVEFLDRLVHGCYRSFGRFDLLAAFTMYYFAGAIHSEECRQKGLAAESDEFLFSHHAPFRAAFERGYARLLEPAGAEEYECQVAKDIAPYNTAGLCDPAKNNMYPYA